MHLSERARSVSLSATLALDARAKALQAAGRDVINMAVGEPDFEAPAAAREAAARRARSGPVRYTPAAGALELRRAIADHLEATRGVRYGPNEITVCHSTKHALSGAVLRGGPARRRGAAARPGLGQLRRDRAPRRAPRRSRCPRAPTAAPISPPCARRSRRARAR